MNNLIKNLKVNKIKLKEKLTILGGTIACTFILMQNKVFADSNTDSIDSFISFACDWLTKIRRSYCFSRWSNVCITDGREKMQKENLVDL